MRAGSCISETPSSPSAIHLLLRVKEKCRVAQGFNERGHDQDQLYMYWGSFPCTPQCGDRGVWRARDISRMIHGSHGWDLSHRKIRKNRVLVSYFCVWRWQTGDMAGSRAQAARTSYRPNRHIWDGRCRYAPSARSINQTYSQSTPYGEERHPMVVQRHGGLDNPCLM